MTRIEVDRLTKQYGAVRAVDDLSFTLEPGSITGFVGPNGSGKSTTLRMMLGLTRPTAGRALIDGKSYLELKGLRGSSAPSPTRTSSTRVDVDETPFGCSRRRAASPTPGSMRFSSWSTSPKASSAG